MMITKGVDRLLRDMLCWYCRELLSLATLRNHPHVVGLREAYLTPHHLAIVMEYAGATRMHVHTAQRVWCQQSHDIAGAHASLYCGTSAHTYGV